MSRLATTFQNHQDNGNKSFVPYICSGDPDIETSIELALLLDRAGADILELGIPFSDPLADGPTIQQATQRSLNHGTRISDVFDMTQTIRNHSEIPIVYMTYYNPIFRFGENNFIEGALDAGADGILVVDYPPEEGKDFYIKAADKGLDTVLLATPTTPSDRIKELSNLATGFLYYVMVTGVTGVRSGYNSDLAEHMEIVGEQSELPTIAGFGVSDIDEIAEYLNPIEGVVVGSYLIECINRYLEDFDTMKNEFKQRAESLAEPLHQLDL